MPVTAPTKQASELALELSSKTLLEALTRISGAVAKSSHLEVLTSVLLESDGNALTLRATNLEAMVKLPCATTLDAAGAAAIPFQRLRDFASVLAKDTPLRIALDGRKASVKAERAHTTINCYDPDDFPSGPTIGDAVATLPAKVLLEAAAMVAQGIAVDETRLILMNMLIALRSAGVDFASADGFRLHSVSIGLPDIPPTEAHQFLIPRATVTLLGRLFDPAGPAITLHPNANSTQLTFMQGARVLTSRTSEGQFPDWHRLVPQSTARQFTAPAERWTNAIRIAAVYGDSRHEMMTVDMPSGAGEIELAMKHEAESVVTVEATGGEANRIALNYRYFLEAIDVVPAGGVVTVGFNGPASPLLIQAPGHNYTAILIPMHEHGR